MKLILLSPPDDRAAEFDIVQALFASGLRRYHLRKPDWDLDRMTAWLEALPARWRGNVWLHSHHELAADFQVGGIHFRDCGPTNQDPPKALSSYPTTSRACHDIASLKLALGGYDSVLLGPVFPSLSKPGYGPMPPSEVAQVQQVLLDRQSGECTTAVFALGGIKVTSIEPCRALGFDGVAVLGAIWNAPDPIRSFLEFINVIDIRPVTTLSPLESAR